MDNISKAIEAARIKFPLINCKLDELMKYHTSFKIGGPLRAMFFPQDTEALVELCSLLYGYGATPLIIGNGTNLLVDDSKPLELIAVKTTGINGVKQTGEVEITAEAGISLPRLAVFAYECSLTGLEYAHGIPGSLGGAVSINAGAYGNEMKDVVYSTNVFACSSDNTMLCSSGTAASETAALNGSISLNRTSNNHHIYTVSGMEHGFSYRHSRFSDTADIILSSVLKLEKSDKNRIGAKMDDLYSRRFEKQPLDLPNAGSIFKRPNNGYAAALIEQAGLKGFSIGGAQVSEKHSGFIVNSGGATFTDIMAVIEHIRATIHKRFGVELEPEVKIIRQ